MSSINIDRVIDANAISALQIRVVVTCFFLALVDGFDAMSIAYAAPVLKEQFGLSPDTMGHLISAALIGLMIGAFVGSPLADRFGRKPIIISSTIIMGVFSLLTTLANGVIDLFVYRFLTGIGLGALMPNINVLTAEFSPVRQRAFLMTAMYTGLPIGTIVGGFTAAGLIDQFGWQPIFLIGGVVPLLMVPFLVWMLPESPHFLALKNKKLVALATIINKIDARSGADEHSVFDTNAPHMGSGIKSLFENGQRHVTLLLWLIFFANLLTLNAMTGWLPSLLDSAGFPLERAILVTMLFSVGGVSGGLAIAAAIDRYGARPTMISSYLAATVAVAIVGQVTGSLPLLMVCLFLAGATIMGSQFGLNAIASASYYTGSRATGLGWALSVGRLGGISGPIIVGAALATNMSLSILFLLGTIPMMVSAACVLMLHRTSSKPAVEVT